MDNICEHDLSWYSDPDAPQGGYAYKSRPAIDEDAAYERWRDEKEALDKEGL